MLIKRTRLLSTLTTRNDWNVIIHVIRRLDEVLLAREYTRRWYSRRDNRRRLGVTSETESVGGGTRKDVKTRVSLIRHFIMSFTLFLRVSDCYPCRKCLGVHDDGISDGTWQRWRAKSISLSKTHSLYIRTFTRPYDGHVNNNHACSHSLFFLFLSFFFFHSVHSYNTLRSSTITFSTNLLLLAPPPSSTLSSPLRIYHHFSIFLIITCMGYPWTLLMRKHVTSDSRTNHDRDSSISLRLFDKRSLATLSLTKSKSSALSNRRRPHLRTVPPSQQAAYIPYWFLFCRTKPVNKTATHIYFFLPIQIYFLETVN